MMKNKYIGSLLHLTDPTLPIGGYSHSNGLETYVLKDIVRSSDKAKEFVISMLTNNIKYNDASFVKCAYEAALEDNFEALVLLDQECTALKSARELREASYKLGVRLIKIFKRPEHIELISKFEKAIANKQIEGHYCIAFGIFAQQLNIPLDETLYAFYYNAAIGMITNAVKLVPLGQIDGQDIMFEMHPLLYQLVEETLHVPRELMGLCNIAFDIRCMQHERLYSRLYMS